VHRRMIELEIATLPEEDAKLVADAVSDYGDIISSAATEYRQRQMSSQPMIAQQNPLYLSAIPFNGIWTGEEDDEPISVLFVDYGNSCRSPMAEAVFKRLTENLPRIGRVDSAGSGDWPALMRTDPRTVTILYRHGIDSTRRHPRQIIPSDFDDFMYILAVSQDNMNKLKLIQETWGVSGAAKVLLFGSFGTVEDREVSDPWGKDLPAFENVFDQLVRMSYAFLKKILEVESQAR